MKHKIYQIVLFIIYLSLIIFFSVECLKDSSASTESSNKVVEIVVNTLEGVGVDVTVDDKFRVTVRKVIGHFSYFLVLGITSTLFYLSIKRLNIYLKIIINLSIATIFSFITEFLFEKNSIGRSASILDVSIDLSGFFLAFIIIFSIYLSFDLKKYKNGSDLYANT